MTRRELREHLMKELFLREFYDKEEYADQCALYRESLEEVSEEEAAWLAEKAAACIRIRKNIAFSCCTDLRQSWPIFIQEFKVGFHCSVLLTFASHNAELSEVEGKNYFFSRIVSQAD